MRLLDRHIYKELIGPFFFGVAAFTSLMFAGKELFSITELIAESKISLWTALELVGLFLPSIIVMTLPMSMLLAALLGFGKLSGDSETVAFYASGISLYRISVPVVVMAVLVTAAGFVLSEIVAPRTNKLHAAIIRSVNPEKIAPSDKRFVFADAHGGSVNLVYVDGGRDEGTGALYNVTVTQYRDGRPVLIVHGSEARYEGAKPGGGGSVWSFRDGFWQSMGGKSVVTMRFSGSDTRPMRIDKTPEEIGLYQTKPDQMDYGQLKSYISTLERTGMVQTLQMGGKSVQELKVKLYQKISIPLAALVFALVGVPLGIRPQRASSAMGLGLSIVLIFAYWVLTNYVTILGNNGTMAPAAAAFLPTVAGVAAGIALLIRAPK